MNVSTDGTPRPSLTARDYTSIREELLAYITQTRPDLLPDFNDDQGLGPVLVDLVALVGDIGSGAVDAASLAVFLSTTLQYDAALRFARSIGYVPRSATAASVQVTASPLPDVLTASGGTFAAGQALGGPNGTTFHLDDDAVVIATATTATIELVEGVPYTETTDTTNRARFSVRTSNGVVAQSRWQVFVADATNPANEWFLVDNVSMELGATQTYEASFDGRGRLTVQFGDGVSGKIPDDVVTILYRTTAGKAGNVAMRGLSGTLVATVAGSGDTISVSFTNASAAASGGADRETLDEMRVKLPAFIRSSGKLTTISDFDAAPLSVAGIAAAFALVEVSSYNGNVVNVNVWGDEDVMFTGEGGTPFNRSLVPYERYAQATTDEGEDVLDYLTDRTSVTVFPKVSRPGIAWVDLYVRSLSYDSRFSAVVVHAAVTAAVVKVFEDSDGFSIRLANLYDAIRSVAGVRYFTLDRLVFEYSAKARAHGTIQFSGGLQPLDEENVVIRDGVLTATFEFDTNNTVTVGDYVPVTVGGSAHDTMVNLVARINATMPNIIASKTNDVIPTAYLLQRRGGAAYNLALATSEGDIPIVVGMMGGSDTVAAVREDRRLNPVEPIDPWPVGTYTPGAPFTGSTPWADGGILPYYSLTDPVIPQRVPADYQSDALAYNHEIIYDATLQQPVVAQAINLRRLFVNLIAD